MQWDEGRRNPARSWHKSVKCKRAEEKVKERENAECKARKQPKTERERERARTTWLHSKGGITAAESVGYGDEVIPSSFPQEMTSHLDVINTNISGSCAVFRRQNNVGRHDRIAYVGRGNLERVSARSWCFHE